MLNCKQGDLAVVVRSTAGHEGKLLTCIRFIGAYEDYLGIDYWLVDRVLTSNCGEEHQVFRDIWLRPLRDSDAQDEILRMVGKPVDSLVGA